MKINRKILEALKPCEDPWKNYLKHYSEFEGDLEDFLALDEITYNDKSWVFRRLATKEQNVKWALMCAESVLYIFEKKYPNDMRPRNAINAVVKYIDDPTDDNKLMCRASSAAAYAAYDTYAAAYDAAAASSAASYAASSAEAAYAAAYDAAAAASAAAASSAEAAYAYAAYAADARKAQQDLNLLFMIEAIR